MRPPEPPRPTGDLYIWDITYKGAQCTIVSQDPPQAPTHCPECQTRMDDHCIGCNSIAHYYIRSCDCRPHLVWNVSRYD